MNVLEWGPTADTINQAAVEWGGGEEERIT